MIYSVLLAIGDSLTNGARDPFGKSWPHYLAEDYFSRFNQPLLFANESVNGEIISTAARRVYPLLKSYPDAHEVVFFEGTNDAKPSIRTPSHEYQKTLQYIVNAACSLGRHIYLPTLPGLVGFGTPDYDTGTVSLALVYNEIIREIAAKTEGATLVELADLSKDKDNFSDGVHLSYSGNKVVALRILKAISDRRFYG